MSDFVESIEGGDLNLETLKRQVAYTFLDAYGDTDGADILFELIVKATEARIIKLLKALATHNDCIGEHHEDYVWNSPLGIIEMLTEWDREPIALIEGETE